MERHRRGAAALLRWLVPLLSLFTLPGAAQPPSFLFGPQEIAMAEPQSFIGLWVTADKSVRHELLPNGRYVEARGTRERAYEGRYVVTGTHIEYWDDTGFTADGDFIDGVLHHGGMILNRQ